MSLINCPIHGQVGLHPYVSKALGHELDINSSLKLADIHKVRVEIYDDDEQLSTNDYYLLSGEVSSDLTLIVIRTEKDEENLLKPLMMKFKGGGYCVRCFRSFLSNLSE